MSDSVERTQKFVWILVHETADGWIPSFDYPNAWKTRRAARKRHQEIGLPKSLIYRIAKYEFSALHKVRSSSSAGN